MKQEWVKITADAQTKTTTIDIEGTIGGDWWSSVPEEQQATKENIKAALKQIAAVKGDTIVININSLGGDVNHGLSIHDLLAQNPARKIVNINGMTASSATVIAMAGDVIKMSDNALFLVHRASAIVWGNAEEMASMIEDLKKIDNLMAKIYSKRSGKSVEDVLAQMDKNTTGEWMTADEAKEFGFVDEVFEPTKMAATFDKLMVAKAGLPEIPENKLNKNQTEMEVNENQEKAAQGTDFLAGFISKFRSAFKSENVKSLSEKEIDAKIEAVAAKQAEELKSEFETQMTAQAEEHKKEVESINASIETLKTEHKKEVDALVEKLTASESEVEKLKVGETTASGDNKKSSSLTADTSKSALKGNAKAAEENAKSLRASLESSEDEDEEEEGEKEKEKE